MGELKLELIGFLKSNFRNDVKDPALLFVSLLNSFLETRGLGRVIIVGGYAVELYSGGAYRTGDVDLVVEGCKDLVVEALDYISPRTTRIWLLDELGLVGRAIDIVSDVYSGIKKPIRLDVGEYRVYVEPPENTILSSIRACIYWSSDIDCEKAAMVMASQWERIDWETLLDAANIKERAKLLKIRDIVREVVE